MPEYKYSESNFENAVIELFEKQNYTYECGYDLHRTNEEIMIVNDFREYLFKRYSLLNLQDDEIETIIHNLLFAKGTSLYATMKMTLSELRKGIVIDRSQYGLKRELIEYFDYENPDNNIFKVINQFEVKDYALRRPDVVIFVNGIPVSVIELKNVSDAH